LTIFFGRGGAITLPKPHQWPLLEHTTRLHAPFKTATKDISRSSTCASLHIPAAAMLTVELVDIPDDGTGSLNDHLMAEVAQRFQHLETDMLLAVTTFLDPR
jgi:hypothetical protein